jgi:hypothetical protein
MPPPPPPFAANVGAAPNSMNATTATASIVVFLIWVTLPLLSIAASTTARRCAWAALTSTAEGAADAVDATASIFIPGVCRTDCPPQRGAQEPGRVTRNVKNFNVLYAKRIGLTSIPAASSVRGNGPEKALREKTCPLATAPPP